MKKFIVVAILAAVAYGGWNYYSKSKADATKRNIPERFVAMANTRDIESSVEVSGDVTPAFQLDVRPEVGGKIKKLHVIAGQDVKEGDLLVDIDDTDLQTERSGAMTEIEGAKLSVEKNRRNFERSRDLFKAKLISREVFDNISSDLAIAENSLAKAQRRLDIVDDKIRKTRIHAPSNGTVLSVGVIEGQVVVGAASVNSGTSLMTIADLSKMLVDTRVNQVDVSKLKLNQTVSLSTESLRDEKITATISFIAPVASTKNNVKGFQVQAVITNPDPRLRPGMTVTMTVPVAKTQGAIAVPISAVFAAEDNSKFVYVRSSGTTEKRPVNVGISNLYYAEIKSGLHVGEEILLIEPRPTSTRKRS